MPGLGANAVEAMAAIIVAFSRSISQAGHANASVVSALKRRRHDDLGGVKENISLTLAWPTSIVASCRARTPKHADGN